MKYRLKKWYPALRNDMKVGDIVSKYHEKIEIGCGKVEAYMFKGIQNTYYIPKREVENNPEFWELVEEKDYEILSLSNENGAIATFSKSPFDQSCLKVLLLSDFEIYSVKRLSDGEVFTVGDKVSVRNGRQKRIKRFELDQNSIRFRFEDGLGALLKYFRNPDDIKHAKQPLFITEDGVGIHDGDKYYYFNSEMNGSGSILSNICTDSSAGQHKNYLYFSTKEKAKEWIEYNKPQYSKNDILIALNESIKHLPVHPYEIVKRYFKAKLDL